MSIHRQRLQQFILVECLASHLFKYFRFKRFTKQTNRGGEQKKTRIPHSILYQFSCETERRWFTVSRKRYYPVSWVILINRRIVFFRLEVLCTPAALYYCKTRVDRYLFTKFWYRLTHLMMYEYYWELGIFPIRVIYDDRRLLSLV